MERVSILLLFSCSLVAAIHAGDLKTCARNYKKVGCFTDKSDQSKSMLVYDRYNIQWKNIEAYLHSLACRCEEKARERKFAGFAIHFWGECYGKTQDQLNAVAKKTKSDECTGDQTYKGCFEKDKECAGHAYTDFVYELTQEKDTIFTMRACNDSDAEIRCNDGKLIDVTSQSYGPNSAKICGPPVTEGWTSNCAVFDQSDVALISSMCGSEGNCNLKGWTKDLRVPCPEKPKYLEIQYKCKARAI